MEKKRTDAEIENFVFNIYKNFGVAPKDLFGQRLK